MKLNAGVAGMKGDPESNRDCLIGTSSFSEGP